MDNKTFAKEVLEAAGYQILFHENTYTILMGDKKVEGGTGIPSKTHIAMGLIRFGYSDGLRKGKHMAQSEIRTALGIRESVELTK